MIRFEVLGKDLKRALDNVNTLTNPPKGVSLGDKVESTMFTVEESEDGWKLLIVRGAPYLFCCQEVELMAPPSGEPETVTVVQSAPKNSGVIDCAAKLGPAIKGPMTNKGATVTVEIAQSERLTILDGTELVGELAEAGTPLKVFQFVLDAIDMDTVDLEPITMFNTQTLAQFQGVKVAEFGSQAPNVDLAKIKGADAARFRIGKHLSGVVSLIDRDIYAKGGPVGHGPGGVQDLLEEGE